MRRRSAQAGGLSAWESDSHGPCNQRFAGQGTSGAVREYPSGTGCYCSIGHAAGTQRRPRGSAEQNSPAHTGWVSKDAEPARASRLIWQTDNTGASCDLSGHFWAIVTPDMQQGPTVWSWMIIGYENQVLAAGQTGDLLAAKLLVEEWDRWVCRPDAPLDCTDNPPSIAGDCTTYQPVWPRWHKDIS